MNGYLPTPWKICSDGVFRSEIRSSNDKWVADAFPEGNPTSAFIVKAANCHDDLVASLRDITECAEAYYRQINPDWSGEYFPDSNFGKAHAALDKAKGPS